MYYSTYNRRRKEKMAGKVSWTTEKRQHFQAMGITFAVMKKRLDKKDFARLKKNLTDIIRIGLLPTGFRYQNGKESIDLHINSGGIKTKARNKKQDRESDPSSLQLQSLGREGPEVQESILCQPAPLPTTNPGIVTSSSSVSSSSADDSRNWETLCADHHDCICIVNSDGEIEGETVLRGSSTPPASTCEAESGTNTEIENVLTDPPAVRCEEQGIARIQIQLNGELGVKDPQAVSAKRANVKVESTVVQDIIKSEEQGIARKVKGDHGVTTRQATKRANVKVESTVVSDIITSEAQCMEGMLEKSELGNPLRKGEQSPDVKVKKKSRCRKQKFRYGSFTQRTKSNEVSVRGVILSLRKYLASLPGKLESIMIHEDVNEKVSSVDNLYQKGIEFIDKLRPVRGTNKEEEELSVLQKRLEEGLREVNQKWIECASLQTNSRGTPQTPKANFH